MSINVYLPPSATTDTLNILDLAESPNQTKTPKKLEPSVDLQTCESYYLPGLEPVVSFVMFTSPGQPGHTK